MLYRLTVAAAFAIAACDPTASPAGPRAVTGAVMATHQDHSPQELAGVRSATARYHEIDTALADGYVDVNVVVPNMGRHLLKGSLVDAQFAAGEPELLVYSPDPQGRLALVAVEYAVALPLTGTPPEGFAGVADVWFADQQFNLWTLHAWVWRDNPDGIFNPTNTRVP